MTGFKFKVRIQNLRVQGIKTENGDAVDPSHSLYLKLKFDGEFAKLYTRNKSQNEFESSNAEKKNSSLANATPGSSTIAWGESVLSFDFATETMNTLRTRFLTIQLKDQSASTLFSKAPTLSVASIDLKTLCIGPTAYTLDLKHPNPDNPMILGQVSFDIFMNQMVENMHVEIDSVHLSRSFKYMAQVIAPLLQVASSSSLSSPVTSRPSSPVARSQSRSFLLSSGGTDAHMRIDIGFLDPSGMVWSVQPYLVPLASSGKGTSDEAISSLLSEPRAICIPKMSMENFEDSTVHLRFSIVRNAHSDAGVEIALVVIPCVGNYEINEPSMPFEMKPLISKAARALIVSEVKHEVLDTVTVSGVLKFRNAPQFVQLKQSEWNRSGANGYVLLGFRLPAQDSLMSTHRRSVSAGNGTSVNAFPFWCNMRPALTLAYEHDFPCSSYSSPRSLSSPTSSKSPEGKSGSSRWNFSFSRKMDQSAPRAPDWYKVSSDFFQPPVSKFMAERYPNVDLTRVSAASALQTQNQSPQPASVQHSRASSPVPEIALPAREQETETVETEIFPAFTVGEEADSSVDPEPDADVDPELEAIVSFEKSEADRREKELRLALESLMQQQEKNLADAAAAKAQRKEAKVLGLHRPSMIHLAPPSALAVSREPYPKEKEAALSNTSPGIVLPKIKSFVPPERGSLAAPAPRFKTSSSEDSKSSSSAPTPLKTSPSTTPNSSTTPSPSARSQTQPSIKTIPALSISLGTNIHLDPLEREVKDLIRQIQDTYDAALKAGNATACRKLQTHANKVTELQKSWQDKRQTSASLLENDFEFAKRKLELEKRMKENPRASNDSFMEEQKAIAEHANTKLKLRSQFDLQLTVYRSGLKVHSDHVLSIRNEIIK